MTLEELFDYTFISESIKVYFDNKHEHFFNGCLDDFIDDYPHLLSHEVLWFYADEHSMRPTIAFIISEI